MPGVNPVILIQMLLHYGQQARTDISEEARTFVFQKNNLIRVHKETDEEVKKRKSRLSPKQNFVAERAVRNQLRKTLKGRCGKVWIDPKLARIAVPLETAAGNSGFGVLPTGSRIDIPEGKFIRAFTYWEKVNDIDLSVFALTEDGRQEEFSWRNMFGKQGKDICYSGDQTSGYNGGSEYFDIDIEQFRIHHPDYRYLIFCDNVYSSVNFSQCDCKAGFMIREENPEEVPAWKGERDPDVRFSAGKIFDPRTVATSYRINADSTFAYLFAIDLPCREMIWLNIARNGQTTVAGTTGMAWLKKYLKMADIFTIADLYGMAGEIVNHPDNADILISDDLDGPGHTPVRSGTDHQPEIVHSWDFEKMLSLLKA